MLNNIVYAGRMLSDFNTYITNAGVYSTPARDYESVAVPGRSGNLIIENNKFANVEHLYPVIIMDDFDKNYAALKAYLLSKRGYNRLADTFCPDEFYMASFARIDKITQRFPEAQKGSCVLVFDRKPQRYLKTGENTYTFTASGELLNPTQFDALPLITVYGSGAITIGDISIEVTTTAEKLDIDCELQEVLQAGGNLDITLTDGAFPVLKPGANALVFSGFSQVEITPRWWTL